MQCAAVISRSPALLRTTLAVQKCVSLPFWSGNSAPTAFVPLNARASGFRTGLRSWAASADWVTAPGVHRLSVAVSATATPVAAPRAGRASRDSARTRRIDVHHARRAESGVVGSALVSCDSCSAGPVPSV